MKILTEDQATKYALRGEHIILEVYGQGVDGPVEISLVVDRKDVAAFINEFNEYFPERDPVDMAKETLRTMISVAGQNASEAGGVLNTGGNLVGFVGGMLVPLTAKYFGWTAAVSMGAVFALIAALLWFFIRGDRLMGNNEERWGC